MRKIRALIAMSRFIDTSRGAVGAAYDTRGNRISPSHYLRTASRMGRQNGDPLQSTLGKIWPPKSAGIKDD